MFEFQWTIKTSRQRLLGIRPIIYRYFEMLAVRTITILLFCRADNLLIKYLSFCLTSTQKPGKRVVRSLSVLLFVSFPSNILLSCLSQLSIMHNKIKKASIKNKVAVLSKIDCTCYLEMISFVTKRRNKCLIKQFNKLLNNYSTSNFLLVTKRFITVL